MFQGRRNMMKAIFPMVCGVCLTATMMPKISLRITASEVNSNSSIPGLAVNQPGQILSSNAGSRASQAPSPAPVQQRVPDSLAQGGNVICQRQLSLYTLLQRVRGPNGCFDQIVNLQTRQIISRRPAPCTCPV